MEIHDPRIAEQYDVLDKLGEGGMGTVYRARHRLLNEIRVIKTMHRSLRQNQELVARFKREAQVAIRVRHPNIAQIYDFSLGDSGNPFIVMEHIEGVTLETLMMNKGALPLQATLELARQALDALAYLHRKGLVHRDISPDNLMVGRDRNRELHLKLIDLGIAKVLGQELRLTETGLFLGKVRYSSPEQLEGSETQNGPLDGRSDIYSLGLVIYEMLTGRFPIFGSSPPSWIAGHLFHPPLSFADSDPEGRVPDALRQVVTDTLAKDREQRPADAKGLWHRLKPLHSDTCEDHDTALGWIDRLSAVDPDGPTRPLSTISAVEPHPHGTTPAPWQGRSVWTLGSTGSAAGGTAGSATENPQGDRIADETRTWHQVEIAQVQPLAASAADETAPEPTNRFRRLRRQVAVRSHRLGRRLRALLERIHSRLRDLLAGLQELSRRVFSNARRTLEDLIEPWAAPGRRRWEAWRHPERHIEALLQDGRLREARRCLDLFAARLTPATAAALKLQLDLLREAARRDERSSQITERVDDRSGPHEKTEKVSPAVLPRLRNLWPSLPSAGKFVAHVARAWRRRPRLGMPLAVTALGLVLGLVGHSVRLTSSDASSDPPGILVLDARPWAEVEGIRDASGRALTQDVDRYTPLTIPLAPGTYRVELRHDSYPNPAVVTADIKAGEIETREVRFGPLHSVEQLLRGLGLEP